MFVTWTDCHGKIITWRVAVNSLENGCHIVVPINYGASMTQLIYSSIRGALIISVALIPVAITVIDKARF